MNHIRFLATAFLTLFVLSFSSTGFAQQVNNEADLPCQYSVGQIRGKNVEIDFYTIKSKKIGPTVLVTGGVHGNEPAGFRAAEQIRNWKINKGTLVVIPEINRLGLAANTRWLPKHRNNKKLRDLNRNFPTKDSPNPRTEIAKVVWKFAKKLKPDYHLDLHEGFDFHLKNPKSVGSSVITHRSNKKIAALLVETINKEVSNDKQFALLAGGGPVTGSLAAACANNLQCKSFIFETTTKKQDLSTRVGQHRTLVTRFLKEIDLLPTDAVASDQPFTGPLTRKQTKVAVFDGPGAGAGKAVKALENYDSKRKRSRSDRKFFVVTVGPKDVTTETLNQFDVVLFPGGSASRQGKSIGLTGRKVVQEFVKRGGGYVGICAGAYLATSHYKWSFGFMNASVFNKMVDVPGKGRKSMWYRGGPADIEVKLDASIQQLAKTRSMEIVRYQNGPILSVGSRPDLPSYNVLARFQSENGIYEAQKNTMIGAPAIVASKYGKGKVLAISPHFESTKGKEAVLARLLTLVSSSKETSTRTK